MWPKFLVNRSAGFSSVDTIVAILAPDFANTTRYVCAALRRKPPLEVSPSWTFSGRSHAISCRLKATTTRCDCDFRPIGDSSAIPEEVKDSPFSIVARLCDSAAQPWPRS